jgi:hypothetical protein
MTDKSKHDMRDEIPAKTTITNTNSRMAGGVDNPNVKVKDEGKILTPGASGSVPDGQNTKSS